MLSRNVYSLGLITCSLLGEEARQRRVIRKPVYGSVAFWLCSELMIQQMLYILHYIIDWFHICKIQWNIIKDEMRWNGKHQSQPQQNRWREISLVLGDECLCTDGICRSMLSHQAEVAAHTIWTPEILSKFQVVRHRLYKLYFFTSHKVWLICNVTNVHSVTLLSCVWNV